MTFLKYVWRVFIVVSVIFQGYVAAKALWPLNMFSSVITAWAFIVALLSIAEKWLRNEA